jgi:hypothetical protein
VYARLCACLHGSSCVYLLFLLSACGKSGREQPSARVDRYIISATVRGSWGSVSLFFSSLPTHKFPTTFLPNFPILSLERSRLRVSISQLWLNSLRWILVASLAWKEIANEANSNAKETRNRKRGGEKAKGTRDGETERRERRERELPSL